MEEKSKLLKNIESKDGLKLYPLSYHADRLVELKDVTISYEENEVCSGVSFEVRQGERICLSGANGCGKSSILKLILGNEEISYIGTCQVGSGVKISYVSQNTDFLKGTLREIAEEYDLDESLFKTMLRKLDLDREQLDKDVS